MNFILSIAPIIFYFVLLRSQDTLKVCSSRFHIATMIYGLSIAGILWFCHFLGIQMSSGLESILEEILKGLFVVWLAGKKKIGFLTEGLVYGATIGATFALFENILYVITFPEMTAAEALIRGISTSLLHIGSTAIVGALSIIFVRELGHFYRINPWPFLIFTTLPSIILHLIYNAGIWPSYIQIPLFTLFLILFIAILFAYDQYLIKRWFETMVESEINLLSEIKRGNLHKTWVGAYLTSLQQNFSPEEIADIMACITLHLELSVAAKCQLMLKETGLSFPDNDKQAEHIRILYTEYLAVSQRIGHRGILAIKPILRITPLDLQAFKILSDKK